jgi:hypothetical protein
MENNKNTQYELNKGLAQMLKGGVIMDVTTPEQARIAEAVLLWRLRESLLISEPQAVFQE